MTNTTYYLLSDNLGREKIDGFYRQYPKYKDKKTILYAPTFRKDTDCTENLKKLIQSINFDRYNLIIKLHPLDKTCEINEYIVDKKYNTLDLLKISDYIITDYSAVAFEASILNKPLYFYVYDIIFEGFLCITTKLFVRKIVFIQENPAIQRLRDFFGLLFKFLFCKTAYNWCHGRCLHY